MFNRLRIDIYWFISCSSMRIDMCDLVSISFSFIISTERRWLCFDSNLCWFVCCLFVTCQNLHFGNYVRLTVCLCVNLSGWKVTSNSWTHWHIFTKFYTHMRLGLIQISIYFQDQRSNNQIIMSQNKSRRILQCWLNTQFPPVRQCTFKWLIGHVSQ